MDSIVTAYYDHGLVLIADNATYHFPAGTATQHTQQQMGIELPGIDAYVVVVADRDYLDAAAAIGSCVITGKETQ